MNIRFVSSLTPEDEDRLAPGLVQVLAQLLDALPLAYTLRVETATGRLFQHAHAGHDTPSESEAERTAADTAPERARQPDSLRENS